MKRLAIYLSLIYYCSNYMKCTTLAFIIIAVSSLLLTTGCNDNEDTILVKDPTYVKDAQNRWLFGPVASIGCRDFIDYVTNHEWEQVSITTLNSIGEEISVSDPENYGEPLHIFISSNSITDINNPTYSYQFDFYSNPIPDGVQIETWDPLNTFVGIIGNRWNPGKMVIEDVGGNIFATEMSLIDYYPRTCIRKMKLIK